MPRVSPAQLFPNCQADQNGITIPYEDLVNVTQAEIDPVDGDAAILLRGLIEAAFNQIQALPASGRPTRMTILQGTQSVPPNLRNALRQPYTVTFDVTAANFEVAAE